MAFRATKSDRVVTEKDGNLPILSQTGKINTGRVTCVVVADGPEIWGYGTKGIGTECGVFMSGRRHNRGWSPVADFGTDADRLLGVQPGAADEAGPLNGYLGSIREGADHAVIVPVRGTIVWVNSYSGRVLSCAAATYRTEVSGGLVSSELSDPFGTLVALQKLARAPVCVAVSAKADLIAVGCKGHPYYPGDNWPKTLNEPSQASLLLLDWSETGTSIRHELRGPEGTVNCVAFSSDGTKLYSGGNDSKIRIWRVADGSLEQTIDVEAPVVSISVQAGSSKFVYCTERGHIVLADSSNDSAVPFHKGVADPPSGGIRNMRRVRAAFSPDGGALAIQRDGGVETFGGRTLNDLGRREFRDTGSIEGLAWSPDGRRLGVAFTDECFLLEARYTR